MQPTRAPPRNDSPPGRPSRPPADSEVLMTEEPRQRHVPVRPATAASGGVVTGAPWSPGSPSAPQRSARRTVASYTNYADAERAVDRLPPPRPPPAGVGGLA